MYLRGAEAGAQDVAKTATIRSHLPVISPDAYFVLLLLALGFDTFSFLFFVAITFRTSCFLSLWLRATQDVGLVLGVK